MLQTQRERQRLGDSPAGESALVCAVNSPQPAESSRCTIRPFGLGGGDAVHALEEQRVVAHQQLCAVRDRLVGDRGHRVDGQQDPTYVGRGVAADQAHRVPAVGVVRREPLARADR